MVGQNSHTKADENHTYIGVCERCGKRSYTSRAMAKRAAKRMKKRDGKLSAYQCGDFWHLGHLPNAVRQGEETRWKQ